MSDAARKKHSAGSMSETPEAQRFWNILSVSIIGTWANFAAFQTPLEHIHVGFGVHYS